MNRYQFRLDNVLHLKQQLLQRAEQETALAQQHVAEIGRRIDDVNTELIELAQRMQSAIERRRGPRQPAPRPQPQADWAALNQYSDRLNRRQIELRQQLTTAQETLALKRQQQLQMHVEVEGLETLRRQKKLEFEQEFAEKQQRELDEFILRQYTPTDSK